MKHKFDVTTMIEGAVAAFMGAAGEPDHEVHNRMIDTFNRASLADYDHADLFKLTDYLEKVILAFRHAWKDADRSIATEKLERVFGDEITLLKSIAGVTQYSPRLYSWAAQCHEQFIEAIYEPEFYKRRLGWADMDLEQRKGCILELMEKQAQAYSKGVVPFITPDLKLFDAKNTVEGYVSLNKNLEKNQPDSVPVWLASNMFLEEPTYKRAMLRAYHEMIHHITLQLALAVREGKIKQDHPLYADGELKLARIENAGHIHGDITPVYSVDGEENLAYEQEFQLYTSCVAKERKMSPS